MIVGVEHHFLAGRGTTRPVVQLGFLIRDSGGHRIIDIADEKDVEAVVGGEQHRDFFSATLFGRGRVIGDVHTRAPTRTHVGRQTISQIVVFAIGSCLPSYRIGDNDPVGIGIGSDIVASCLTGIDEGTAGTVHASFHICTRRYASEVGNSIVTGGGIAILCRNVNEKFAGAVLIGSHNRPNIVRENATACDALAVNDGRGRVYGSEICAARRGCESGSGGRTSTVMVDHKSLFWKTSTVQKRPVVFSKVPETSKTASSMPFLYDV